jgi:ketosteroid isomerase-like protein
MNADDKRANIPEGCDRLFAACVESRDLDSLIGLYEPNASLVRRDHTVAAGHAEIRQVLQRLVTERTELRMSIVRIVASGDLAMLYNDWVMRML